MGQLDISRSVLISKPVQEVFAAARDFSRWPEWSPWLIMERECQLEFADDGESYSWDGKVIGSGKMAVTGETQDQDIRYHLEFFKPWKSEAEVTMLFQGEGEERTRVTWSMQSKWPWFLFFMKGMMEGLIGMDYERGLSMLKEKLETGQVDSELEIVGPARVKGFRYLGLENECSFDEIGESMTADLDKLEELVKEPSGPAFSQYHKWDFKSRRTRYTIGIPTEESIDGLKEGRLPDCDTYQIRHLGDYEHLGNAWAASYTRARAKIFKMKRSLHPFEIYEDDKKALVCMPRKG